MCHASDSFHHRHACVFAFGKRGPRWAKQGRSRSEEYALSKADMENLGGKDRTMSSFRTLSTALLGVLCIIIAHRYALAAEKPRIVVMTDIGGDPDDQQSMVRCLLYACDFEVESLCTGFGHGHYKDTRPDLIRQAVDAYGKVVPNLRKHRPDYPSHERLRSLIKDGHNGDPHKVGQGMDSEASE